jgi:hypothetical protein
MKPIVLLLPLKPLGQVLGINLIHIEVVPARCSYSIGMKLVGACGVAAKLPGRSSAWGCLPRQQRPDGQR